MARVRAVISAARSLGRRGSGSAPVSSGTAVTAGHVEPHLVIEIPRRRQDHLVPRARPSVAMTAVKAWLQPWVIATCPGAIVPP